MFHINFYYEENPIKCDFLSQVTLRNHAMMYKKNIVIHIVNFVHYIFNVHIVSIGEKQE